MITLYYVVAAAALFHPLPKMDVVVMLAGIVEETLVLAEGALDHFLDRLVLPLGALSQVVYGGHVSLMMLVMMEFEPQSADRVRLDRANRLSGRWRSLPLGRAPEIKSYRSFPTN